MTDSLGDSVRAVKEVAKTTGKAIDAARDTGGFLDRIFGGGIEDWVGLHWSDKVHAKRIEAAIYDWERLQSLFQGAKQRLGLKHMRVAAPKILIGIIEHATLEEEVDLHQLWSNLLATALDENEEPIERNYISVLADLSSDDARALKEFHAEQRNPKERKKPKRD